MGPDDVLWWGPFCSLWDVSQSFWSLPARGHHHHPPFLRPPLWQPKTSPDIAKCTPEGQKCLLLRLRKTPKPLFVGSKTLRFLCDIYRCPGSFRPFVLAHSLLGVSAGGRQLSLAGWPAPSPVGLGQRPSLASLSEAAHLTALFTLTLFHPSVYFLHYAYSYRNG